MVATIRGLKALIKNTTPGKLVRTKAYTCYKAVGATNKPIGAKLRGVARRLGEVVFSKGELPMLPTPSKYKGRAWRGADGGIRRGKAVDSQVSRLARGSAAARSEATPMLNGRGTARGLEHHELKPIEAQRVVLDRRRGIATAADVVCQRNADELALVEQMRLPRQPRRARAPQRQARQDARAAEDGRRLRTASAFCAAGSHSCALPARMRHGQALENKGIRKVSGALLYVDDEAELHELGLRSTRTRILDCIS